MLVLELLYTFAVKVLAHLVADELQQLILFGGIQHVTGLDEVAVGGAEVHQHQAVASVGTALESGERTFISDYALQGALGKAQFVVVGVFVGKRHGERRIAVQVGQFLAVFLADAVAHLLYGLVERH